MNEFFEIEIDEQKIIDELAGADLLQDLGKMMREFNIPTAELTMPRGYFHAVGFGEPGWAAISFSTAQPNIQLRLETDVQMYGEFQVSVVWETKGNRRTEQGKKVMVSEAKAIMARLNEGVTLVPHTQEWKSATEAYLPLVIRQEPSRTKAKGFAK